jgi:hypothetical protein
MEAPVRTYDRAGDMTKPRQTGRVIERRLGWLLVVLAAFVWPSVLLHEATTFHAVCPEHGELLDVEFAPGGSDHGPDEPGVRLSAAENEEGAHELCPFVVLGQPASPAQDVPCGRILGEEPLGPVEIAREFRFQSIPILRLAPKQSPPAIA